MMFRPCLIILYFGPLKEMQNLETVLDIRKCWSSDRGSKRRYHRPHLHWNDEFTKSLVSILGVPFPSLRAVSGLVKRVAGAKAHAHLSFAFQACLATAGDLAKLTPDQALCHFKHT